MLFELCSQKRCVTSSWAVLDCEGSGMRHKTGSVAINGTLRRVLLTSVVVEMQWVLHILNVCLELQLLRKAQCAVFYCYPWPVWLYQIFPPYHIKGTIFSGVGFLQLLSEIFIIVRILQRYYHKCPDDFIYSSLGYCQILMKPEFSRHIVETFSVMKFHENPFSGSRVPCGRRVNHDEANICFSNILWTRLKVSKRQKEPEETINETSGCVRPERKWPNSVLDGGGGGGGDA
jgi:hypothetical protein